ncbi:MAG: hypothetical protein VKJ46_02850 [Leptolyngbyaceae bacterium]|nr:hypothetical protein [Leptolyngbyaceae bacterium]
MNPSEILLLVQVVACSSPPTPEVCFLNPGCGCAHPGEELKCEDCPYLESCLSRSQSRKFGHKS